MYTILLQLVCLLWAKALYAAPSEMIASHLQGRAVLLKPADDPFYKGPGNWQAQAPGTILRQRLVPNPIAIGNNGTLKVKTAWQILYRSTDAEGNPQAAMTTLLIPNNPDYTKLLSYQIAYDSSYINCGPSYQLQKGADMSNGSTTAGLESLLIKSALDMGWVVNTPDYEGDKGAFTAGPQAAQATLDSVWAVLKSNSFTGVSPQAKYALWGYSGGCLASGWASEMQPSYAPDLTNFVGTACGGNCPNVTSTLYAINGTSAAGLGPAGTMGLGQAYKNMSTFIDANLVPATAAKFKSVLTQCASKDASDFQNQDLFKYFTKGERTLSEPIPKSVLRLAGQQGLRDVPKMPLYFYKAIGDEICPTKDTDALYANLCSRGASIHYVRDLLGNHGLEAILGAPGALGWLRNRFNGVPVPKTCSQEPLAVSTLSPDAIEVLGPLVYSILVGELGDPSLFFPGR